MRIQTKLLVSIILLVLLSSGAYTAILLSVAHEADIREADARLLAAAHTARAFLGQDYHKRIGEDLPVGSEEFERLVAINDDLCRRTGLQYLWSVLDLDGKIVFTSASHSNLNDPRSACGGFLEVHDDPHAFAQAMRTMQVTLVTFDNKWGRGRMILVPDRDAHGRTYVIGASIHLDELSAGTRQTLLSSLLVCLLVAATAVVVSILFSRSLSRPVVRLTAGAKRMAGGDLDTQLEQGGCHEVAVLARSLDTLRQAIRRQFDALQVSEAKYRALLEQIPAITYTICLDDDSLVYVSPAVEQVLGVEAKGFYANRNLWSQRLHPDDRERILGDEQQARNESLPISREYRMIRDDGRTVWLRDEGRIVAGPQGRRYLHGVALDVTAQKELEQERTRLSRDLLMRAQQLRKLAAELTRTEERERKRLAHILHDDLQQLVVGAKIYVESETGGGLSPASRQALERAALMLEQALHVSRSLTSELSPPVLHESGLGAALTWLQGWVREKHRLEVEVCADPQAEPQCEDTRTLLFRAVQELLFNVVKHSGVHAARVTTARKGNLVEITVGDRGQGFDWREGSLLHQHDDAFGLLSIQERLGMAGGGMEIDSAPGQGTRVTLRAPLAETDDVGGNGEEPEQETASPSRQVFRGEYI